MALSQNVIDERERKEGGGGGGGGGALPGVWSFIMGMGNGCFASSSSVSMRC